MQNRPRNRLVRTILAMSAFIALIVSITYIITTTGLLKSANLTATDPLSTTPESPAAKQFFYRNIGNSPKVFTKGEPTNEDFNHQFTVELEVTSDQKKADAILTELTRNGIDAFYTPFNIDGKVYFKIREGIYRSKKDAELAVARLKKKKISAKVRQL